ncbi:MAG: hypothetical protein WA102_10510 [Candidatus Methanoperedens sp.]
MSLKCVKCYKDDSVKDADYVVNGDSLCIEHLPENVKKEILPIYKKK